jgi:hypothetical protein
VEKDRVQDDRKVLNTLRNEGEMADWLKKHPEPSGRLIERALIMTYEIKEPKKKGGK